VIVLGVHRHGHIIISSIICIVSDLFDRSTTPRQTGGGGVWATHQINVIRIVEAIEDGRTGNCEFLLSRVIGSPRGRVRGANNYCIIVESTINDIVSRTCARHELLLLYRSLSIFNGMATTISSEQLREHLHDVGLKHTYSDTATCRFQEVLSRLHSALPGSRALSTVRLPT
jgi:hypothetical protein